MKRHAYKMDLLRPNITKEDIFDSFKYKRELTIEDIERIVEVAVMIQYVGTEVLNDRL